MIGEARQLRQKQWEVEVAVTVVLLEQHLTELLFDVRSGKRYEFG